MTNPYDPILLRTRVETCRARVLALMDAKSEIDSRLKAARLNLEAAMEELFDSKQTRMFK